MATLSPEASRLYRVRKTTVKMLHNRCVLVIDWPCDDLYWLKLVRLMRVETD